MGRIRVGESDTLDLFPAAHRYARMSARKARLVMDVIRGESVESALTRLRFSQRRAAPLILKVIESAVANATQKKGLELEDLVVYRAYVDEGPTMKRWRPRSMGRAFPRLKRTCHLTVVLREGSKKDDQKSSKVESSEASTAKGRSGSGKSSRPKGQKD